MSQFYTLSNLLSWDVDEMRAERRELQTAMSDEFVDIYGIDGEKLENWVNLCNILEIEPVPSTLKGCRDVRGFCAGRHPFSD